MPLVLEKQQQHHQLQQLQTQLHLQQVVQQELAEPVPKALGLGYKVLLVSLAGL